MATYDISRGQAGALAAEGLDRIYIEEREVDFSLINGGSGAATGDIIKTIPVQSGDIVEWVAWKVKSTEGAAGNVEIGDGSDTDGFSDGTIDVNSTGSGSTSLGLTEGTPNTINGYTAGKHYTNDDTINVKPNSALNAAKLQVAAKIVRPFKQSAIAV